MRTREEVEQEIQEVRAAISAQITSGVQSYTVGSRSLTRLSLSELRDYLNDLEAELEMIDNGGSRGHLVGWHGR